MNKILVFLLLIGTHCFAADSKITFYFYPPSHELDWSQPRKALSGFVGIELEKLLKAKNDVQFTDYLDYKRTFSSKYGSTMGHSIAHIQCAQTDSQWVSFSGQDFIEEDYRVLFKEKLGLSVLFRDYIDGHIIVGAENVVRLIFYQNKQKHKPRYLELLVSDENCKKVQDMAKYFISFNLPYGATYDQFLAREKDKGNLYFGLLNPHETYHKRLSLQESDPEAAKQVQLGGGCAPFAVGLMQEAGCYDPYYESQWRRKVTISEKLMGDTIDAKTGKVRKIPPLALFGKRLGKSWTYPGIPNQEANMYDPQKIWDFAGKLIECSRDKESCDAGVAEWLAQSDKAIELGAPHSYESEYGKKKKKIKKVSIEGVTIRCP